MISSRAVNSRYDADSTANFPERFEYIRRLLDKSPVLVSAMKPRGGPMTMPVRMSLLMLVTVAAFVISACADGESQDLAVQDVDGVPAVVETRTVGESSTPEGISTIIAIDSHAEQSVGDEQGSQNSLSGEPDEEEYIITWVDPPGPGGPVAVESRVKGTDSASSTASNSGQADGGEDRSQDQQTSSSDDKAYRTAWIDPPGPEGPFAIKVVDDGKPVEFEVDAPSE